MRVRSKAVLTMPSPQCLEHSGFPTNGTLTKLRTAQDFRKSSELLVMLHKQRKEERDRDVEKRQEGISKAALVRSTLVETLMSDPLWMLPNSLIRKLREVVETAVGQSSATFVRLHSASSCLFPNFCSLMVTTPRLCFFKASVEFIQHNHRGIVFMISHTDTHTDTTQYLYLAQVYCV